LNTIKDSVSVYQKNLLSILKDKLTEPKKDLADLWLIAALTNFTDSAPVISGRKRSDV